MMKQQHTAGKYFLPILISWLSNGLFFTALLFAEAYTDHIEHWTNKPLAMMCITSGVAKVILTICLIGAFFNMKVSE
jgi:hypothetical protein